MAETTLADLVTEVADAFGKYRKGTVSSDSSTTTLIDEDNLYESDDYWIGNYVYILEDAGGSGAAPEGEERPITDYDQSEGKCTVSPAFTSSISSGDTYEILPLRRDKIKRAINRAIESADRWLVQTTNTSAVTVADDDYDYSLPSDVVEMSQMWTRDEDDDVWLEVPGNRWRVLGTPGSQTLYFNSLDGMDDGDTLRLEYMAHPSTMSADTDTLGMGEPGERGLVDFVVSYALYWLCRNAALQAPKAGTFRPYLTMMEAQKQEAEKIKREAGRQRPAGRVHAGRPPRSIG